MKRDILILSALCTCCNLFAEEITVKYLRYAGLRRGRVSAFTQKNIFVLNCISFQEIPGL